MLADDGTVIVKFFLHISRKEQKKRFEKIAADPLESWRVTKEDWARHKKYDEYLAATEEMLELTESEFAPWTIVEATSKWYARRKVFDTIITDAGSAAGREGAGAARIDRGGTSGRGTAAGDGIAGGRRERVGGASGEEGRAALMFETLDLSRTLDRKSYVRELTRRQIQLRELGYQVYLQKRPVVLVFEGWDAAGKGGAIKRITEKLDPRGYIVYPISAPQGEDKTRHYLYRFWRRLPEKGQIAIFDRSWYGRVLVERVEGFATEAEWKRAYKEINSFERQLRDFGTILAKFWMHISRDEQLRRFEERKRDRLQGLEADRRGLAQPRQVGRLRRGGRGDAAEDQHADRAVDADRGQRQVPREGEGAVDAGGTAEQGTQLHAGGSVGEEVGGGGSDRYRHPARPFEQPAGTGDASIVIMSSTPAVRRGDGQLAEPGTRLRRGSLGDDAQDQL